MADVRVDIADETQEYPGIGETLESVSETGRYSDNQ